MMHLRSISFLLFIILMAGCKRNDCNKEGCGPDETCIDGECQPVNIVCGVHEHLEGDSCACDAGWFGPQCDTALATCGENGHANGSECVCDSGWTGTGCNIFIERFAGRYHVTGNSTSFVGGSSYPPHLIDDTMEVIVNKDTLFFNGYNHVYVDFGADLIIYYPFLWTMGSQSNYSLLKFKKVPDDSLFFSSRFGGLSAGNFTVLTGVKIE